MTALMRLRSVISRTASQAAAALSLHNALMHVRVSSHGYVCLFHYLVVQVTELLHQVFGDPLPSVGLVMSHPILGE